LIPQPGATNQSKNGFCVFPEAFQARQQRITQFVDAAVAMIPDSEVK
jgi:hypothetical protein